jgi:GNAT superfamily N-acetyltransferase
MMSSLRTRYFQFLEHCREDGFLSACGRTFYKVEEMVPTEKDLATLRALPADEDEGTLLDLGPENYAGQAVRYPLRSRRERAPHFFRRGYRTVVLVKDGRVAGDIWYVTRETARTTVIHPHLRWFGIDLGEHDVYLFDMHVDHQERGSGLATRFHARVLQRLREQGFRRAYGYFAAGNIPALWMHRLIGYRELPRCVARRFFLHETVQPKR